MSVASDPMVVHRYTVTAMTIETADVSTIEIAPLDAPVPPGRPGQFHMCWAFGVGEVPISISGLPDGRHRVRHTTRAVGRASSALHDLQPGDTVGVRGPFGTGWDVEDGVGSDVVVVAGGIGLAPLHGAVERVLALRRAFGRLIVVAGARTPSDLPFAADLRAWSRTPDSQVIVTVDRADEHWPGPVGLVTEALTAARFDPSGALALVCGPEPMMRAAARDLVDRGVAADRIRLSLERNMHCGVAWCGHCQLGGLVLCRDGPVVPYERVAADLQVSER